MPVLYLHIGTAKTGSTAIQSFLYQNRKLLKRLGYCFPLFARSRSYVDANERRNAHFLENWKLDGQGEPLDPHEERVWHRYMGYVENLLRRYPRVILTDEGLWRASVASNFRALRLLRDEARAHGFEVRVIVYLRRQDQYFASLWAQKVKAGEEKRPFTEVLAKSAQRRDLDYYAVLERIAALFGRDHILARIYDRNQFVDGDIISDFMRCVGLPRGEHYATLKKDANPSIGGELLEIRRIINNLGGLSSDDREAFRQIVAHCRQNEASLSAHPLYTRGEAEELLGRYAQSNRKLARDYFGDANRQLFEPLEELPEEREDAYMHEEIIRFYASALSVRGAKKRGRLPWIEPALAMLRRLRSKLRHKWRMFYDLLRYGW